MSKIIDKIKELKNKKIAILGLGVNNEKLVDFLLSYGLKITICDQNPNKKMLLPAYSANKNIKWKLGSEYLDNLTVFDIVFRSPGIPFLNPKIQKAKKGGVEISSQTKLFFELCPAKIIGVTGTKGKGTTSTLIYEILKEDRKRVFLAGNIGQDPFDYLKDLTENDIVVLELSSFQLQDLDRSPQVAVVLNITIDHLDYHQDREEYVEAKKAITKFQTKSDYVVINADYQDSKNFKTLSPSKNFYFSVKKNVLPGAYMEKSWIYFKTNTQTYKICQKKDIKLVGEHNLENILAALTSSIIAGASLQSVKQILRTFSGLGHRLEHVATIKGVKYYNDSLSTIPQSTITAINSFDQPIILIVGGSDKGVDFSLLAQEIIDTKIKALIAIGTTTEKIFNSLEKIKNKTEIISFTCDVDPKKIKQVTKNKEYKLIVVKECQSMGQVVRMAGQLSQKGDIVLLSPACASFDMFKNAKHRGDMFRQEVLNLKYS